MQEKKNKRLMLLLVVLIISTVCAAWFSREGDTFEVDKNLFRSFDFQRVDEVTLQRQSEKVTLRYNGSRWRVNDAYDADRNMIDVLFATMQQAEPRRPVAASMRDSVMRFLKESGVRVSLSAAGTPLESFFAGGDADRNQAYFAKDNGDPYLMTIPGYRVYVAGIFELPEGGWRNKLVFAFNWRNFQKLDVNFPQRPGDNFTAAFDNNLFSIQGMTSTDTTRLNNFVDDLSLLTVEEYVPATTELDSLGKTSPVVVFAVSDVGQRQYTLQLYAPQKSGKIFGLINGNQWAVLPAARAAGLVRPRAFFAK